MVLWRALVDAPVGSGKDAALTAKVPVPALAVTVPDTGWVAGKLDTDTEPLIGCVTPLPSTGTLPDTKAGVLPSMELRELLPVTWLAAVAAPVGSGEEAMLTGTAV
jgi:hypothetical protein